MKDLRRYTTPLAPASIIINESKEKHVENKTIEEAKWAIIVDQTLIAKQFGVNVEGAMDVVNALVKLA